MAFVQAKSAQGSNATSVTTASITTTSGSLIVVVVGNNGVAHTSVTDNKGNTYTQLVADTAGAQRAAIYYCANVTGGSGHTFTYTSALGFPSISVSEWSGMATASVADGSSQADDTTSPYNTTSDPTTTNANDVLIVGGVHGGSSVNFVAGTSYTLVASGTHPASGSGIETDSANMPIGVNYRIVTSTGTYDGEIRTSANAAFSLVMGCFKEAAAAGTKAKPPFRRPWRVWTRAAMR